MCGQDRCKTLTGSGAWSRAPRVRVRGVERASLCARERHAERLDFGRADADEWLECERHYQGLITLTMRIFETLSLSCCVFDRLLRRSSNWGWVKSVNSIELTIWG